MINDVISDFITRIRNASLVRHQIVQTRCTKLTKEIAIVLKNEGFIEDFEIFKHQTFNHLFIYLKYKRKGRQPGIRFLKRVSKPGRRIYSNKRNLPKGIGNFGTVILSTSRGIMSDRKARKMNFGGEILFYIY